MKKSVLILSSIFGIVFLFTLTLGTWYSSTIDVGNPDLVGYWELSSVDASNVTSDSSLQSNDGTLGGYDCDPADCNLTTARYGNGIEFDGDNDYIVVGSDSSIAGFDISDSFSACAWTKSEDVSDNSIIGEQQSTGDFAGWMLDYNDFFSSSGGTVFHIVLRDSGSEIIERYTDDDYNETWHHVCFTYDGSNTVGGLLLYVDGTQPATSTNTIGTITSIDSGNDIIIGSLNNVYNYFNGTLDDVRIYNRTLTNSEVKELYSCRIPDSGDWNIITTCNIDTEDFNKSTLTLNIESAGVVNLKDTNMTVDRIVIANGGRLTKDDNSNYYVV